MYLSIRDEILFAAGYSTIAEGARDLDIAGVELFVIRDDTAPAIQPTGDKSRLNLSLPNDLAELKRQSEESGVRIAALCMANNFNAQDKRSEIDWAVRTVRAAVELGVPVIRIDTIMTGEKAMSMDERRALVVGSMREILNRTDDTKIDLGIENHGFQGNDPEFLTRLLGDIGSPRLGLTLDSGNFYWRGWPLSRVYEIFEKFAPIVKHTHIKNIAYPVEIREIQREIGFEYGKYVCPIHEGDIDHTRYFTALRKAGYDRDLCLEDESLGKFSVEERNSNLRTAAEFFRGQIGG